VGPAEWKEIARIIEQQYESCCGVVILHGTDTMAYTATALSFMLVNLAKPVIVTGAQLPISAPGTDAVQNLVSALRIAAGPLSGVETVPEVCLFFRDRLLRGCRSTKICANGFDAFESPNYPALAMVDHKVTVFHERIRPPSKRGLRVRTQLAPGVVVIRVAPGLEAEVVRRAILGEGVSGVVIQAYGSGNVPTRTGFLDAIAEAIHRGRTVVSVTQCSKGRIEEGRYKGSAMLQSLGVISGGDMTTEAALLKLQLAIAEHEGDSRRIREALLTNWAGERSV